MSPVFSPEYKKKNLFLPTSITLTHTYNGAFDKVNHHCYQPFETEHHWKCSLLVWVLQHLMEKKHAFIEEKDVWITLENHWSTPGIGAEPLSLFAMELIGKFFPSNNPMLSSHISACIYGLSSWTQRRNATSRLSWIEWCRYDIRSRKTNLPQTYSGIEVVVN